jgi:hypothetical protein
MTFRTFIKHVEAELVLSCPGAEVRTITGRHCWRRAPYEAVITLSGPAVEGLRSGLRVTLKEFGAKDRYIPLSLGERDPSGKISEAIARHLHGHGT